MKMLAISPVLASVMLVAAPAPVAVPGPPSSSAPSISFENPTFSFGKIPDSKPVMHAFKVTNKGNAPLTLQKVAPSCGCTSSLPGKSVLAPGESTEIETTFNPKGAQGVVRKSVQVLSDDPVQPSFILHFDADVQVETRAIPPHVQFGDLSRAQTYKTMLRLEDLNGPISRLESSSPFLAATTREGGDPGFLEISLDGAKLPVGQNRGDDTIDVHPTGKAPIRVLVHWETKPSLAANPMVIAWAEPAGKALKAKLEISNTEGKPFRILETRTSNPQLKIEGIKAGKAAKHELQVVYVDGVKGTHREQIVLRTDDANQGEITVRVSAVIQ